MGGCMYAEMRGLRCHLNADITTQTKLVFPDHATASGICSRCTMEGSCEIGYRAKTGRTLFPQPFGTAQFGAEKRVPGIEDLQIIPEVWGEGIFFDEVETGVRIGGFECALPLAIAALGSTEVAHRKGTELAEGAAKGGIAFTVGENVLITWGRRGLKERIQPFLKAYGGLGAIGVQANCQNLRDGTVEAAAELGAHYIEVKLGQGAKPGLGGERVFSSAKDAQKFRKYGFKVERTADGRWRRHNFPGNVSEEELKKAFEKVAETGLPIWIKAAFGRGIGRLIKMVDGLAQRYRIKAIVVDGHGGGTGMSPWLIMNELGLPSLALFRKPFKHRIDVLLAGGYTSGVDVAKALMMGANGVAIGRAALIAASQGSDGIANYLKAVRTELQMVATCLRQKHVKGLIGRRCNLVALSEAAARLYGVDLKW